MAPTTPSNGSHIHRSHFVDHTATIDLSTIPALIQSAQQPQPTTSQANAFKILISLTVVFGLVLLLTAYICKILLEKKEKLERKIRRARRKSSHQIPNHEEIQCRGPGAHQPFSQTHQVSSPSSVPQQVSSPSQFFMSDGFELRENPSTRVQRPQSTYQMGRFKNSQ
ncbi:hypothetical protein MMC28_009327 [Mycoblastus sanguinarius]|nr:hypothetical protein [Mycoblastus sanguinarius]